MSLAADIEHAATDVKQFVADHFGGVLQRAQALEANPVVVELENAALGPEFEAVVAGFVKDLAGWFTGVKAQPAPAAPADLGVPGDPGTPVPVPVPAGPVVGGQAQ